MAMKDADVLRFWSKVEKTESCWLWKSDKVHNGYGRFWLNGAVVYAHRLSYELTKGLVPQGLTLDHLCRKRDCVNPEHLEAVTMGENNLRGFGWSGRNARKTYCINGHPLSQDNLVKSYRRGRNCLICRHQIEVRYRERHKRKVMEFP